MHVVGVGQCESREPWKDGMKSSGIGAGDDDFCAVGNCVGSGTEL